MMMTQVTLSELLFSFTAHSMSIHNQKILTRIPSTIIKFHIRKLLSS